MMLSIATGNERGDVRNLMSSGEGQRLTQKHGARFPLERNKWLQSPLSEHSILDASREGEDLQMTFLK